MTSRETAEKITELACKYNDISYFMNDPVMFPRHFFSMYEKGQATRADVEISGIIAAHLAWGKRELIVRDCRRAFDTMQWKPLEYIMGGRYRQGVGSLHRTVKWNDFARVCNNLKIYYSNNDTLEGTDIATIREDIYGQKPDSRAANKKIHMFYRWMVRRDGIVDIGLWKNSDPVKLIIPLDVHVHRSALNLGITSRKSSDIITALEITEYLRKIFPEDPCKGDFALFAYAVSNVKNIG
jgi:hypothetical protein